MDSVFPILNSAELPSYIWGNNEREKVKPLFSHFQNIELFLGCLKCVMLTKTLISVS